MTITTLIKKLKAIQKEHGDLEVDLFTTRIGHEYNQDHEDPAESVEVGVRQKDPWPKVVVISGANF